MKDKILGYFFFSKRNKLLNNKDFFNIVDRMPSVNVNSKNIPKVLKNYINIFHVEDLPLYYKINYSDPKKIMKHVIKSLHKKSNVNIYKGSDVITAIDYLDYSSGYFPSIHTDIEWSKLQTRGYQFWALIKNGYKGKFGNMFLFYNKYLYKKYKNTPIAINLKNKRIEITSNTYFSVSSKLLEWMSIEDF